MSSPKISLMFEDLHLTKEAQKVLGQYLDDLQKKASTLGQKEQKEIIEDIREHLYTALEARIQHTKSKKDTIDAQMVLEVIDALGEPEEYLETNTNEEGTFQRSSPQRRLFRLSQGKVFGGVCLGIAEYLRIDVVFIRALFVITALTLDGLGLLAYLILWLVIPVANSPKPSPEPNRTFPHKPVVTTLAKIVIGFFYVLLFGGVYFPIALFLAMITVAGLGSVFWIPLSKDLFFGMSSLSTFGFFSPLLGLAIGFIGLFLLVSFVHLIDQLHFQRYIFRSGTTKFLGRVALVSIGIMLGSGSINAIENLRSASVSELRDYSVSDQLQLKILSPESDHNLSAHLNIQGSKTAETISIFETKTSRGRSKSRALSHAQELDATYEFRDNMLIITLDTPDYLISRRQKITLDITLPSDLVLNVANPFGETLIKHMNATSLFAKNTVGILKVEESTVNDLRLYNEAGKVTVTNVQQPRRQAQDYTIQTLAFDVPEEDASKPLVGSFTVSTPPAFGREDVETVTITGLEGLGEIEVITDPLAKSTLYVSTQAGVIEIMNATFHTADISSQVGAIILSRSSFVGDINSQIGAVDIYQHSGALSVHNSIGSITATIKELLPEDALIFSSKIGEISLSLPPGMNPSYDLHSSMGEVSNTYRKDVRGPRIDVQAFAEMGTVKID